MPSPFPGMDPFIESQMWDDFHTEFITAARELLVQQVRPQYVVNIERCVFVIREHEDRDKKWLRTMFLTSPNAQHLMPKRGCWG